MTADQNAGRGGGQSGDGERRSGGDQARARERQGDGGAEGASSDDGQPAESGGEDKPSPLANPKVRIALIVGAVLAAALLVYGFVHYRSYGRFQQSTNDAYLDADQINVCTRIAGYVEQVPVSDNQVVKAGALLVVIDQRNADATAAQAGARIAQAQASVAQARATRVQQFDAIRQALAQAAQDRAQLERAEATDRFNAGQVARYAPLSAAGAETDERLAQNRRDREQSRTQVAQAQAQAAAAGAQVASAHHQLAIDDAQVRSGLAQVAAARAQLAADRVDVDAAAVRSSIAGRIGDRTVRVGQYVQVGTRLMTVVPIDRLYLTANFKETQIGLMRVGQPATIKVDALPGENIHGVVESFSPGTGSRFAQVPINNATGNFTKIVQRVPVRIHVDAGPEARRGLVPGLSVTVSVDTRSAKRDVDARGDESHRLEKRRDRQRRDELQRDRNLRLSGAGQ